MATLADVIRKRRSSGQSRTGSLMGSLKEKFLEKIDPRQFLNQSGVLTALFPSLKTFRATGSKDSGVKSSLLNISTKINEKQNAELKLISRNTQIAAKNYSLLPIMARDVNVMKQNIGKMVGLLGSKKSTKPDAFFTKQRESEKLYETTISEMQNEESKLERLEKNKKKPFNWIRFIGIVGTGVASALLLDFAMRKDDSILYEAYTKVNKLITDFNTDVKKFISSMYQEIEDGIGNSINLIETVLGKVIDEFDSISITDAIDDFLDPNKSVLDQFDKKLSDARNKISEGIKGFSIIPSAQAAIMPPPEPEVVHKEFKDSIIAATKAPEEKKSEIPSVAATKAPEGKQVRITSPYGKRTHPVTGEKGKMHHGIDVGIPTGTEIKSVAAGKITFSGEQRGYGYSIEVEHEDKSRTFYAHLSKRMVNVGDIVGAGQVIALSGGGKNDPGRGTSTGSHLHFELRMPDASGRYKSMNPGRNLVNATVYGPTQMASKSAPVRDVADALDVYSAIYSDGQYDTGFRINNTDITINNNNKVNVNKTVTGRKANPFVTMLNNYSN